MRRRRSNRCYLGHTLMQVSEKRAVLAQSVASIFNAVFSRLWINRSYLTDNTQPTTLSIFLTATFTLTVKPFSLGSYCTFFFLFFPILDSDVLLDEQYLKTQKKQKQTGDVFFFFFLFHSVYQLYAHVLCMFLQRLDEIL